MSDDVGQVLSKAGLISVTADIVAAYVANNSLPPADVLLFIEGVHTTFARLQQDGEKSEAVQTGSVSRSAKVAEVTDLQTASSEALPPEAQVKAEPVAEFAEAATTKRTKKAAPPPPPPPSPTQQVDEKLSRKAQRRNPPNPVDPRTGELLPLKFEELVPDEEGFVFDPAWIDPDVFVEQKPVVPIEKTVKADSIICLENGKELKVLKRHLDSEFGLTPDAYRRKWGLSDYYPLVTHTFSTSRSKYAKAQGLGKAQPRGR